MSMSIVANNCQWSNEFFNNESNKQIDGQLNY